MNDRQRKAMFAQKVDGLNKVTVKPVNGKYLVLMNSKKVFSPTNEKNAREQLRKLKIDAYHHDKTGVKLNE